MSIRSIDVTVTEDDGLIYPQFFTDEQLHHAIDVVFAKACALTKHNKDAAEEITSDVLERISIKNPGIHPDKLDQFLCKVTRNVFVDRIRRNEAAYRKFQYVSIDDLDMAELAGTGAQQHQLYAQSASAAYLDQQYQVEIALAFSLVLHSLPERKRRLVEMTADGYSNDQIAEELGFASADVVKVTMSRIKRELRQKFAADFAHLFAMPDAA